MARVSRLARSSTNEPLIVPVFFNPMLDKLSSSKHAHHTQPSLRCSFSFSPSNPTSPGSPPQLHFTPSPAMSSVILKAFKAIKKPTLSSILVFIFLLYVPAQYSAIAATGGRVGGRTSSRSSTTYTVAHDATPSFTYAAPYYASSPFYGRGFILAPAFGFGFGASSLFYVVAGLAAFVLVSGFLSDKNGGLLTATEKTSVMKLQVGLLGTGRVLQRSLDQIANAADTSSADGLTAVLSETVLALLRHPQYCISGFSSSEVKKTVEEGDKLFNQLSIEERGKFDEETLVNVNNIKRESTMSSKAGLGNEFIVITVLVAAEGEYKLPAINDSVHMKEALEKLGSVPADNLLAVEVLWTPQNVDDTLTEQELLEDYPLLRPL